MNDTSINAFNAKIRATPWYQEWFAQRGLNPNQVKLNDRQREELKQLVEAKSGFQLPGDMKIDPAGNLNEKGGWAGLPTGVKIAIIAGATLATAGAAGAFSGATAPGALAGGGASAGGGAAIPTLASTAYPALSLATPSIAGTSALAGGLTAGTTAAAASPSAYSRIAGALRNKDVLSGAGRMFAGAGNAATANRSAEANARLTADQLQLNREKDARSAQRDAYANAMRGQLAAGYQGSQNPYQRHQQGFITPEAREAGRTLYEDVKNRIPYQAPVNIYNQLPMKPSGFERFSQFAGPALSIFDPRLYDR